MYFTPPFEYDKIIKRILYREGFLFEFLKNVVF